ncbi:MAG: bifunctional hydroxymethylpyrimidine kinase/phosphomethylpyrimidine kinase [Butyrivibrio sp.]|nr:bifunctional hydroxymethylpyrimidine kinase/phosphomethylpyrimidine kinase [Butyrivibrio sp.]
MNQKSVLSIAGSDSSGGAGIQADLKTFEAHGVYGMSVVTALTAQNTLGVQGVMPVAADFIGAQLRSVFDDIVPDAVKVGMLPGSDAMLAVAKIIDKYECKNVVLDPVLSSTSGTELTREKALSTLKRELFSRVRLITPNIPEAERLSEMSITSYRDMEKAAECLSENYGCSVLLKGGHSNSFGPEEKSIDGTSFDNTSNDLLLVNLKRESQTKAVKDAHKNAQSAEPFVKVWIFGERIDNPNTHGTGCTLSSAIASNLALGMNLETAVKHARKYIEACIRAELEIGHGRGPLIHSINI